MSFREIKRKRCKAIQRTIGWEKCDEKGNEKSTCQRYNFIQSETHRKKKRSYRKKTDAMVMLTSLADVFVSDK